MPTLVAGIHAVVNRGERPALRAFTTGAPVLTPNHGGDGIMQTCLFCAIARGDIPSHRVCETDDLVAFLDINPIRPGHTLIVPRAHHDYFDDLPEKLVGDIVVMGQRLARELKAMFGAPRVAFAFMGFDIPHTHAHVLPVFERDDVTSRRAIVEEKVTFRPLPRASDEELAKCAADLRSRL
jgi:histidine triad (HIT) family protein